MIGKKNIVFGFLFLVLTAALGPYMIVQYVPGVGEAQAKKQSSVGRLQALKADDFEEDLEALPPEAIAKANTDGILALNTLLNAQQPVDMIKGGPHAHGNLESLLNIAVGIVLAYLAISTIFKQVISWIFIVGTVLHSGVMYLMVMFQWGWAATILNTGVGPALILLGLLLAGVATFIGYKGQPIQD
ncbi:MAG: hypothetical protein OEZ68_10310 [Gammaproteobacteria bacterium]|nr:hypothetical protein [Gammaproteobacteria bacterium]MDH5801183.1 hypothetical protein [Gammaproteobacteria bacterium]